MLEKFHGAGRGDGAGVREALLFQVTAEQLSAAATRHTIARIEEVLATDPAEQRQAGLSWRKIGTCIRH
ncbi:MAG: hypothetical protein J2P17_11990 [Mycobacterium sp.]|nr:hypothetical protein [Mycobacterium sp.]